MSGVLAATVLAFFGNALDVETMKEGREKEITHESCNLHISYRKRSFYWSWFYRTFMGTFCEMMS